VESLKILLRRERSNNLSACVERQLKTL